MCGEAPETLMHATVLCPEVKNIWYASPLRLDLSTCEYSSFMDWCASLESTYTDGTWWSIFWSLLWGIWLRRNAWVFEKKVAQADEVIRKALSIIIIGEFEKANEKLASEVQVTEVVCQLWKPPMDDMFKVNSDAACFNDGVTGLGGIMRDSVGEVMAATCVKMQGTYDVEVAEAMAARHALSIAIEAGLTRVILETDNIKLFQHLKHNRKENTSFGFIVHDILHLASLCTFIEFSHVGRSGNKVAHKLAQISRNFEPAGCRSPIRRQSGAEKGRVLKEKRFTQIR